MKPLKPSMKENKRYLLIRGKNLKKEVEAAIHDFIGVLGMSKASLAFIKQSKDYAIISVNRGSLNHIRASFAVWPHSIKVEKVSGTLKGLGKNKLL
jgi:RNase P/RNase MRP subunit POP5